MTGRIGRRQWEGFVRKYAVCLGVFLSMAAITSTAAAAGPGEFLATGSMGTVRTGPAVVKLADGRVLVAGGVDDSDPPVYLASAEIYDPATGAFTPTGSMGTGRIDPDVNLLASGKVLISGGGVDAFTATNTAELYDPATGTFSPTASMAVARIGSSSTVLSDGRVLVAGGASGTFNSPVASSTLYNPDGGIDHTGSFTGGVPMLTARSNASMVRLPEDRVLIAGGQNTFMNYYTSAEIWTPTTTNVATGSMSVAHVKGVTSLLPNGKVLIAGGIESDTSITAVAELYNPVSGTFSTTDPLSQAKDFMAGASLADGRVLVAGGLGSANEHLTSSEIYDPASGTFGPSGNLPTPRWGGQAVTLDNGRVLVLAGLNAANDPLSSADLFYPNGVPFDLTISRVGTGSGTVASNPSGIECGATCSASFGRGDEVSLTAAPTPNSVFAGWSGACSGKGTCDLTVSEAKSVTATFDAKPPAGEAILRAISVTPKSRKVRRGGQAGFKFRIENVGGTTTGPLEVCVRGPKKLVSASKCVAPGTVAAGASKTTSFKVKVKKKATKGRKAKLTFTATAPGLKKVALSATVKVK